MKSIFAKTKIFSLSIGIFLISFLLRIFEITVPLNVDEVSWLSRGTFFFKLLFEGNLADTFLRHHPGVTNMWLYGSGMLLNCQFNQLFPGWLDMKQSVNIQGCLNTIAPWKIPTRGWKRQITDMCLWLITICTTIYLIWPAMWVAPLETLTKLGGGLSKEADIGNLFFLGQVTDSPGLVFYPLVLLYRLSPAVQVGLLACLIILLVPKLRRRCKKTPELIALVLVPLCVLVLLSCINRKYDRYLLLAYPELVLLAGVGWISILAWVKGNRKVQQLFGPLTGDTLKRTTKNVKLGILMVGLQIFVLVPHYPYYLTYYNPLFGGAKVAQNVFMMGQGEGLERVARRLNQLPKSKDITVASWYSTALVPYFQGQVLDVRGKSNNLMQANRVVDYINGTQRQWLKPKLLSYFQVQQPLYKVQLHGVDYARVYPGILALAEDLKTEPRLQSGRYQIVLEWFEPQNGKVLEVKDTKGNSKGNQAIIGNVDIVYF